MSKAALTASLALWRRRHRWNYRMRERARKRGDTAAARRYGARLGQAVIMINRRKRQLADLELKTLSGAERAIRWANAQVGTVEQTGQNDGPKILDWQRWVANGDRWLDRAPYCGIGCANACIRHSTVVAPERSRWASVALIEDDARAGRNGFTSWSGDPRTARPGDLVVLYGRGIHVELVRRRTDRALETVGFNTSPGVAGSQNNGGGVWRRSRPFDQVHGIAHVNYRK